jgi:S-DNA-T family DNA segregation ATPase FtsK/SpoIIIE
MIDPNGFELQLYNALPHLVAPVVTDPNKTLLALRWVVNEMEKRYQIFMRVGVRNLRSFNSRPKSKPLSEQETELSRVEDIIIPEKLSYVVVIVENLERNRPAIPCGGCDAS